MLTLKSRPGSLKTSVIKHLSMIAVMIAASASLTAVRAQQTGRALKVQLISGTAHYYMLASRPVITFEDSRCMIRSDEFSSDFDMSDVLYAEFVDHTASVDEQIKASLSVDLSDPGQAVIRGMEPGSATTLINLSGMTLSRTAADENGTAIVPLSQVAAGIYVITSKETTFKIHKK